MGGTKVNPNDADGRALHPRPLSIEKHGHSRFWAVRDSAGGLVVVATYRKGAVHVARLLGAEP